MEIKLPKFIFGENYDFFEEDFFEEEFKIRDWTKGFKPNELN